MKIRIINEPELLFGYGTSVDPKEGIRTFLPNDLDRIRPTSITIGFTGPMESINEVVDWVDKCKQAIEGKESNKHKLFQRFPGFNKGEAFSSEIIYDESYKRNIRQSDLDDSIKNNEDLNKRIEEVVELYLKEIRFLSKNKNCDVIICVLSEDYVLSLLEQTEEVDDDLKSIEEIEMDEEIEIEEISAYETNFRRLLKAKAMKFGIPLQLVRDRIVKSSSDMQDQATIAWNLFTAIYYKAGGTPWSLISNDQEISCFAGISFYKSRDYSTLQTSIAQIFNEYGNGVILRGEPVTIVSEDRNPHLTEDQSYTLMDRAIREYKEAIKTTPTRLVIHKTSSFSGDEMDGVLRAARESHQIMNVDLVTIRSSQYFRIYRQSLFPPRRGTHLTLSKSKHILYTKGSVELYRTFVGKYPPVPLEIEIFHCDSSSNKIIEEILTLTKMNWNNTNFEKKWPITIECARRVGDILKYLEDGELEQQKYSFYM